jgi:hypothetical protein
MFEIWLLVLAVVVLAFGGAAYLAARSWRTMGTGRRILGLLFLAPHFLIVACIFVSIACGHPAQGSPGFSTQFICGVLIVFILPLPALAGTIAAVTIFQRARSRA